MSKKLFWPFVIIFLALLSAILVKTDSGWSLRPYLLFLFVAICPGMAILRLIRLSDSLAQLVLAIALSLALGTFLSELFVLAKRWSPPAILAILITISFLGALLQITNTLRAGNTRQ